jgi:hypothetical protein
MFFIVLVNIFMLRVIMLGVILHSSILCCHKLACFTLPNSLNLDENVKRANLALTKS